MVNNELLKRVGIKENFVEKKRKAFKESYFDVAIKYKKATISMENTNLKNSINEIITFKSGHAEGFGEKVKEGWDTFIEKLKKLWNDFIDGCQALIKKITGFFLKRKVEKVKKAYIKLSKADISKGPVTITAADTIIDMIDGNVRNHDNIMKKVSRSLDKSSRFLQNELNDVIKKLKDTKSGNDPYLTDYFLESALGDFQKEYGHLTEAIKKIESEERKQFKVSKENLFSVRASAKIAINILTDQYNTFSQRLEEIGKVLTDNKDLIEEFKNYKSVDLEQSDGAKKVYKILQKTQISVTNNIKNITKEYEKFLNYVDITSTIEGLEPKPKKSKGKGGKRRGSSAHDDFVMSEMQAQAQRNHDDSVRIHNDHVMMHNQMFNM